MTLAYRNALQDPDFLNSTASDKVSWHFVPPSAPHFGGLWEAEIKSVKHHLRRVLGSHTLTYEEFTTLLYKVEACLNSRPIAPLNDSIDDFEFLTPGHFLVGSAITTHPEPSLINLRENRLTRWQVRKKWRQEQPSIKSGQLVLIRNATLPPCKWELGRVTQCHPGADGLVRVVTVRTATAEYKRPIVKLCILPVDCATSD
ncbi:uncharacterized protein LOC105281452 [Ooceraea biroi]|nr:uncharacterized protein LOC105281452 [Ooceraea biroi]